MTGDRPGNRLDQAAVLDLAGGRQKYRDRIGGIGKDHFFRFTLNSRSSLSLSLSKLKANANLQLLDDSGTIILQTSAQGGTRDELINTTLEAGDYNIRVYSGGRGKSGQGAQTRYKLKVATAPTPDGNIPDGNILNDPALTVLPPAGGFKIQFDYRFDTQGWFTPKRRAALEAAARIWESIIVDDFPDTPVGKATPFVLNPETDAYVGNANNVFRTDTPIDDVMIFVGAQALGGATLAQGAPAGNFTDEERYVGAAFQPWLGSITFDNNTNWFFDATPNSDTDIPVNLNDFISTAVHEIGHILGFTQSANTFNNLVANNAFVGANAMALNGGNPLPLQAGGAHIREGYEFGGSGENLMDPVSSSGGRQLPTMLDAAILDDIGYTINYNAVYRNQSVHARKRSGVTYSRCGCGSCLVGAAGQGNQFTSP